MCEVKQRNAPSLTPELWAEVFAHLELRPDSINVWEQDEELNYQVNQKEVHQMKLVCKHFKEIYASQPCLVQRLSLHQAFGVSSLPSLLLWLHQSKSSLHIFHSSTPNSVVDLVLACLVSSESSIKLVEVSDVTARSVPLIGTFTSLCKCALAHSTDECLDLLPLGSLPKLDHLDLQGDFKELHHLTGLTRLDCLFSDISGVQELATTLRHLHLQWSSLSGVNKQGLAACTALTELLLVDASLEGNTEEPYWYKDMSVVPTHLGSLTQLHTLHLSTGRCAQSPAHSPAEVEWISNLVSLQDLCIYFSGSRTDVLQHAPLLTKLTALEILGVSSEALAPIMNVDIDWHKLHALQSLSLRYVKLQLGMGFAGILELCHLSSVHFRGSTFEGKDNLEAEVLAALTNKFAIDFDQRRP